MSFKKALRLIIVCAALAACQSHRPTPDDTLVIGVDTYPEQLDPRLATDALGSKIKRLIFSGLMIFDDSLNVVPDLAESYAHPDPLVYEVTLRRGVRFHDGAPLGASDVKATYESMRRADLNSPYRASLDVVESIETPSENVVRFTLKKPFLPFLTVMTYAILPRRLAERRSPVGRDEFVGTGPYRVTGGPERGDKLTLKRFKEYYGGTAAVGTLVIRTVQDNTLRALELMKGRLDLVQNAVPYVLVPKLKTAAGLRFESEVGVNFNYLAFNFRNPYLKHRKVRQAVAMSVDRDRIIKHKLAGLAVKADSLLNPRHWARLPDIEAFPFDLERARRLLDEAGFPDPDGDGPATRFDLVYKTSTNKERLEIVQLIAENLRAVGIGVEVRSYEIGTLFRDIRQGDFDLFSLTWVGISDPDIYHTVFHSKQIPPVGSNRGFYANAELDVLLERAQLEDDPARRLMLLHRIQKIVYDDFVYVPLWYDDNFAVMSRRVRGYKLRPDASFFNVVRTEKGGA